ncbi:MAG: efflux RND transporter periplasmic adaptor subunit [Chloroflexi bacterium]|nr:efflux RND transporter periplasmic adaptor subunit [Chloroflexota bacterium]MBU1749888.1 efflux RND transporter periplasmic adaptor subunit [Chloroflexota bacterium]
MRSLWRTKRRLVLVVLAVIALLVVGGGYAAYQYYTDSQAAAAAAKAATTMQTATVTRGNISITASGSGDLLAAKEITVGFSSGGTIIELAVQVGDKVTAGQALARLDDTPAQAQVAQSKIALELTEISLAELTAEPSTAELTVARQNLQAAQLALSALQKGGSAEDQVIAWADLESARIALQSAQAAYDRIAYKPNAAGSSEAGALQTATLAYQKAEASYKQKVGVDAQQVASARAQLAQAQITLANLEDGPTANELRKAQLDVEKARIALTLDEKSLAETTLTAPVGGTVTAISADEGEAVGSGALITLADVDAPVVRFWVEESDLANVAVGYPVQITFEALPDYTFKGQITSIEPMLVTVNNTQALQVWASIDLTEQPAKLRPGLTASVEIVAGEANNVLTVPVLALRETSPGQYAVFVVQSDGTLEMRPVEVGLKDAVNAEIRSGLQEGEVVRTSTTTRSSSSSTTTGFGGQGGPPPEMFFGGR